MDVHAQSANDRSPSGHAPASAEPRAVRRLRSTSTTRTISIVLVVAASLSACGGSGGGGDGGDTRPPHTSTISEVVVDVAALQTMLDEWRAAVHADGATLSIRAPGREDLELTSGIDDRDPERPMPTDGTFYAASILKTMVAAVVLQLVGEGRLALDDPVERWLDEIPSADEITVGMLLDQTAGLGEWHPDILADLTRTYTGEEMLRHDGEEAPTAPPGQRFTYSNANYTAAALLLERELGMGLADIVEQRLASPLGLDDTAIADGSIVPTRHGWFSLDGDPSHPLDNLDFPHQAAVTSLWGAGNLLTSSRDLLTWAHSLYSGDLLGEQLTSAMVDMRNPFALSGPDGLYVGTQDPTPLHYGLGTMGFCLDPAGCHPDGIETVGHGGSIPGSRVLIAHHVPSTTTIVVHANTDDIPLPTLARLPADIVSALGVA